MATITKPATPQKSPAHKNIGRVTQIIGSTFDAEYDEAHLPSIYNAVKIVSDHKGVKVMTMAASKGLEFPVVVVARMENNRFPWPVRGSADPDEHEARLRRTFFVACSRAIRRLMVMTNLHAPSPFIADAEDALWDVRD